MRIGIDIGSSSIKVAWGTTPLRGAARWRAASLPRKPSETPEQLADSLRRLLTPLQRARYSAPVILAVSHSHVRTMTVQATSVQQLPRAVQERLPMLFPFDPSRCRSQYRLLGSPGSITASMRLQLAAGDVELMQRDLQPCWRVGWVPTHACAAATALAALAAAQGVGQRDPTLLLELGARRAIISILVGGEVIFAREAAFGSDDLTEALTSQIMVGQEQVRLSWEQAERLKCQAGVPDAMVAAAGGESPPAGEGAAEWNSPLPQETYHALLQPILEQWLDEIHRTIAAGLQDVPDAEPRIALLSGGGSQLSGLDRWLNRQLGLDVRRLSVQPMLGENQPAFSTVCGLLASDRSTMLNLLPEPWRAARRLIHALRMVAVSLLLLVALIWAGRLLVRDQQRAVSAARNALASQWEGFKPVRTLSQAVETHERLVETLAHRPGIPPGWLKRLAQGFPDAIRLTELSVQGEGLIVMKGQAQAREQSPEASVSELVMWLSQAGVCTDVRLDSNERNVNDATLVDVNLTCHRL